MQIEGKKPIKTKQKRNAEKEHSPASVDILRGIPVACRRRIPSIRPPPQKKRIPRMLGIVFFGNISTRSRAIFFENLCECNGESRASGKESLASLLRSFNDRPLCSAWERSRASSWESLEFNGESRASGKESLASHEKSFEDRPLLGMGKISSILLRILEIQRRIPSILKGIPSIPSECSSMATTVRVLGRNSVESRASSWASLLPCRCCWFAWRCCRCFWFFFRAPSFFINAMEFADRPRSLVVWFFFFE